ncbi:MAG: hypothetical protein IJ716_16005 [Lachnospiraceae bacterium]|nr:hypothetical protein [Lachnospiraceae bacterium]
MKYKRIIALGVVIANIILLSACGGNNTTDVTNAQAIGEKQKISQEDYLDLQQKYRMVVDENIEYSKRNKILNETVSIQIDEKQKEKEDDDNEYKADQLEKRKRSKITTYNGDNNIIGKAEYFYNSNGYKKVVREEIYDDSNISKKETYYNTYGTIDYLNTIYKDGTQSHRKYFYIYQDGKKVSEVSYVNNIIYHSSTYSYNEQKDIIYETLVYYKNGKQISSSYNYDHQIEYSDGKLYKDTITRTNIVTGDKKITVKIFDQHNNEIEIIENDVVKEKWEYVYDHSYEESENTTYLDKSIKYDGEGKIIQSEEYKYE